MCLNYNRAALSNSLESLLKRVALDARISLELDPKFRHAALANGAEVDFVLGLTRPSRIVNVSYSLNDPATLKREVESLEWAKKKHPTASPLLVAHELPARVRSANIQTEPAWRFLLR